MRSNESCSIGAFGRLLCVILIALAGCAEGRTTGSSIDQKKTLRLIVLTDLQGQLEPCGCTSDPKGGIDRTSSRIKALTKDTPALVLVSGDTLFAREPPTPAIRQQSIWQAETLLAILESVGVSAITPGGSDFRYGAEVFSQLAKAQQVPFIAGNVAGVPSLAPELELELGGMKVAVLGATDLGALPDSADPQTIADPFESVAKSSRSIRPRVDLLIVLFRGERRIARKIAALPEVDFVIQSGLNREEALPPTRSGDGWIVHAGRQGQGFLVVDLIRESAGAFRDVSAWTAELEAARTRNELNELKGRIEAWREKGASEADIRLQEERAAEMQKQIASPSDRGAALHGNRLDARYELVDGNTPIEPTIRNQMDSFFQRVNEHNRAAFADRKPPPLGEGEAGYIGSEACASCHAKAVEWWRGTPHGRAYTTLEKRHKEFNLDCVGCHVTGYERPGGSTVTQHQGLIHVGCESCHGPASKHRDEPQANRLDLAPSADVCHQCHTPEHSDRFDYDAYRARLRAAGHRLPQEQP